AGGCTGGECCGDQQRVQVGDDSGLGIGEHRHPLRPASSDLRSTWSRALRRMERGSVVDTAARPRGPCRLPGITSAGCAMNPLPARFAISVAIELIMDITAGS